MDNDLFIALRKYPITDDNEIAVTVDEIYQQFERRIKDAKLAQQVKPLDFIKKQNCYQAQNAMGCFWIFAEDGEYKHNGILFKTLDEAIAAANEEFRRRVLSCFAHGGEQ